MDHPILVHISDSIVKGEKNEFSMIQNKASLVSKMNAQNGGFL
jgi:hypothetical protein